MRFFSDVFNSFVRAERDGEDLEKLFDEWAAIAKGDFEAVCELSSVLSSRAAHWEMFNKRRYEQYTAFAGRALYL